MQYARLDIDEIAAQKRFDDGKKRVVPPRVYDAQRVGETLRMLRVKNGLSQSEVGQKLYVTSQTVSKWESGAVTLLETLVKLAEFYGVTPSAIVCGLGGGRERNAIRGFSCGLFASAVG